MRTSSAIALFCPLLLACGEEASTSDLAQRIEALEQENQDQKGQIYQLQSDMTEASAAMTEQQESLSAVLAELAALDARVEALEGRMDAVEAGLDAEVQSREEGESSLSERLDAEEEALAALEDRLYNETTGDLGELSREDEAIWADLNELVAWRPGVDEDLATLLGVTHDLDSDLSALTLRVDAVEDELEGAVQLLEVDTTWTIPSAEHPSLAQALEEIDQYLIADDVTLTLALSPGVHYLDGLVDLQHPDGAQIHVQGTGAAPSDVQVQATVAGGLLLRDGAALGYLANLHLEGAGSGAGLELERGASLHVGALEVSGFGTGASLTDGAVLSSSAGDSLEVSGNTVGMAVDHASVAVLSTWTGSVWEGPVFTSDGVSVRNHSYALLAGAELTGGTLPLEVQGGSVVQGEDLYVAGAAMDNVQLGWGGLLMAEGLEVRGASRYGVSAVGLAGLLASDAVIRDNGTGLSLWFGTQAYVAGSEVAGNDVDVHGGAGAFAYADDLAYSSISWGPMESDQFYE
jgi:predicted nuclease with TOPRIM domain